MGRRQEGGGQRVCVVCVVCVGERQREGETV